MSILYFSFFLQTYSELPQGPGPVQLVYTLPYTTTKGMEMEKWTQLRINPEPDQLPGYNITTSILRPR